MKVNEYQATKIKAIVKLTAEIIKNNPQTTDNFDYLWANLCSVVPELKDKSRCGGCDRSMKITIYEADVLDGLLILEMAKQVRGNISKGIPFTEANKVHIPTLGTTQGILKRQTKCDYLGLIKQPDEWRGSGYWLLTTWAWKALRGENIPKATKYWEGHLLGRSMATTTLGEMFNRHKDIVEKAIQKRKAIKADHRAIFKDYKMSDWVQVESYQQAMPL